MNVKLCLMSVWAAAVMAGCQQDGGSGRNIAIDVQGAVGNSFRLYAYADDGKGNLSRYFQDRVKRVDSTSVDSDYNQWRYSGEPTWPKNYLSLYAYISCDGVTSVSSSEQKPLYVEYTSNPVLNKKGDLLVACEKMCSDTSSVPLRFYHALSWLSFVWTDRDANDPSLQYKLQRLVVRGKQSGRMTYTSASAEPDWVLVTDYGDFQFRVYTCADYDKPVEKQRFFNPEPQVLAVDSSLYLVPGIAVAAEVEYSIWRDGVYQEKRVAPNLILGGREHTSALLRYNKHYTYTFVPPVSEHERMNVCLKAVDWE